MYRKDLNYGGWFSYNSTRSEWKSGYADKMFDHFFDRDIVEKNFGNLAIDEELLITNNLDFSSVSGKKVLVIGGGPSAKELNNDFCKEYDYIFSCNHFFKSNFLKSIKINLALIGDEVSLDNADFNDYLQNNNTVIGFEHSSKRSSKELARFKKRYPNSFVFLTRYFSRLGYVARACVLARQMNASQVHFIGMDGFKVDYHYFEEGKKPPTFNNEQQFKEQMKIFYEYMLEKYSPEDFKNLSDGHPSSIYTGIMKELLDEKN